LQHHRDLALRFKDLATLRTDAPLFRDVDELRWRGPTPAFAASAERLGDPRLLQRCLGAAGGTDWYPRLHDKAEESGEES
jgi:hypothetical protein